MASTASDMRAVVIHAPHDLRVERREAAAPGPGQVRVRVRAGGICGSDLHYFQHGGFGAVRLRRPMVLGHEAAGEVESLGEGVTGLRLGDPVAINPSLPCGRCRFCLEGMPNHCLDMRFYGSAMRDPHVDGAFRELLVCEAAQAVPLPPSLSPRIAAFAEPLAVCLHAVRQLGDTLAGGVLGAKVLVTGAGPIGVLAVAAARLAGASEVVATDLTDAPREHALRMGADRFVAVGGAQDALAEYARDKGYFDAAIEASGSAAGIAAALASVRPRGTVVQLGLGSDVSLALGPLVSKEIALRGTFRFHAEFALAVQVLARGAVDPTSLLTAALPIDQAEKAFALASDRQRAMKVQLVF